MNANASATTSASAATAASIRRRWINLWEATPEELEQLYFLFPEENLCLRTTRVLIAEDTVRPGRIVAAHVLQLFPHPEPLYVAPEYSGLGLGESLASDMTDFLHEVNARGWIVVATSPQVETICIRQGMQLVKHPVYAGAIPEEEATDGIPR